jgi:hypothetical protein
MAGARAAAGGGAPGAGTGSRPASIPVPGGSRHDRSHRVRRADAHRAVRGGRRSVRLRRGRRRRQHRGSGRQAARRQPGHRECRICREGSLPAGGTRIRRGVRLSRRAGRETAHRRRARRHRRLLRQRGRRAPRSRHQLLQHPRPRGLERLDIHVQRHRAAARPEKPGTGGRQAADPQGLHRDGPRRPRRSRSTPPEAPRAKPPHRHA